MSKVPPKINGMLVVAAGVAVLSCFAVGALLPRSSAVQQPVESTAAAASSSQAWTTNMQAALSQASREHKDIIVVFADSETSPLARQLTRTLDDASLLESAAKQFVLVRFPGEEHLPPALLTSRATWAEKLGVRSLPATFLLDEKGRPCAEIASPGNDSQQALSTFQQFARIRTDRDAAFLAAASMEGISKARKLDEGLRHLAEAAQSSYLDVMTEIVRNDPSNVAGLRDRYQPAVTQARLDAAIQEEVYPLIDQRHFEPAIAKVATLAEGADLSAAQRQMLVAFQGQLYQSAGDKTKAVACLDRALALNTTTDLADRIRSTREMLLQEQ